MTLQCSFLVRIDMDMVVDQTVATRNTFFYNSGEKSRGNLAIANIEGIAKWEPCSCQHRVDR